MNTNNKGTRATGRFYLYARISRKNKTFLHSSVQ